MDDQTRQAALNSRRETLLTVKEYADLTRQNPHTVYRRIWAGRQDGVYRIGGSIRINAPKPK